MTKSNTNLTRKRSFQHVIAGFSLVSCVATTMPAVALSIAEETVPASEAEDISTTASWVQNSLMEDTREEDFYRRGFHTKAHACALAEMHISNDLPSELQVGVFQPGQTYPAWIRYSNGSPGTKSDAVNDVRGIAIKLMGVAGDKLLDGEETSSDQDFLLANSEAFFIPDVRHFIEAAIPFMDGGSIPTEHSDIRSNLLKAAKSMRNPLLSEFWSQTPYQYGEGQAIKYHLAPCDTNSDDKSELFAADGLRQVLDSALAKQDQCYQFQVQFQTDPNTMPIEDPTIEWGSPFITVATLTLPQQGFDGTTQNSFCEELSYNPWHSLADHRPLGGINRARKIAYQAAALFRHNQNGTMLAAPDTSTKDLTDVEVTLIGGIEEGSFVDGKINYQANVRNQSANIATDVVLSNTVPAELTISSFPEGCEAIGQTILCELGDLVAGAEFSADITVDAIDPEQQHTFTSQVTSSANDPSDENNQSEGLYGGDISTGSLSIQALLAIALAGLWRRRSIK